MVTRHVVAAFVILGLAGVPTAAVATPSTVTTPENTAAMALPVGQPCDGISETRAVAYLETDERVGEEKRLYPGAQLQLFVCTDGEPERRPSAWSLTDGEGFEIVDSTDDSVHLQATASGDGTVELASFIEKKGEIPGPSYEIVSNLSTQSTLAGGELQFAASEDRDEYLKAEKSFLTAISNVEDASETVSGQTNGSATGQAVDDALSVLNSTNLAERKRAVQETAFNAALAGDVTGARNAIDNANNREADATEATKAALNAYATRIGQERKRGIRFVRGLTLGGIAIGGCIGIVFSRWRVRSQYENVTYDQRSSSDAALTVLNVAPLAILGVILLVVGIAVAVLLNGGAVLEVIV